MTGEKQRKPSPVDPHQVFRQARRFHWSYQRLCLRADKAVHDLTLVPAMVLSAFASELYLKCLHHIDSGAAPRNEHNLQQLFNRLPSLRRERIETLWKEHAVNSGALALVAEMEGVNVPKQLSEALADGGLGFVQLRYVFEDSAIKFYLSEFPEMLCAAILEIQPTWNEAVPAVETGFKL